MAAAAASPKTPSTKRGRGRPPKSAGRSVAKRTGEMRKERTPPAAERPNTRSGRKRRVRVSPAPESAAPAEATAGDDAEGGGGAGGAGEVGPPPPRRTGAAGGGGGSRGLSPVAAHTRSGRKRRGRAAAPEAAAPAPAPAQASAVDVEEGAGAGNGGPPPRRPGAADGGGEDNVDDRTGVEGAGKCGVGGADGAAPAPGGGGEGKGRRERSESGAGDGAAVPPEAAAAGDVAGRGAGEDGAPKERTGGDEGGKGKSAVEGAEAEAEAAPTPDKSASGKKRKKKKKRRRRSRSKGDSVDRDARAEVRENEGMDQEKRGAAAFEDGAVLIGESLGSDYATAILIGESLGSDYAPTPEGKSGSGDRIQDRCTEDVDTEGSAIVEAAGVADEEGAEKTVTTGAAGEGATESAEAGAKAAQLSGKKKKKKRRSRSRGDSVDRGEAAKEPPAESEGATIEATDQGEDAIDKEVTVNKGTEKPAWGIAGEGATEITEAGAEPAQPSSKKKKKKKRRSNSRGDGVGRVEAAKEPPTGARGEIIEIMDQGEDAETVEVAKGDENEGEDEGTDKSAGAAAGTTPKAGKRGATTTEHSASKGSAGPPASHIEEGPGRMEEAGGGAGGALFLEGVVVPARAPSSGGKERGRRKRSHGGKSSDGDEGGGGVVAAAPGSASAIPQSLDKLQDGRTEDNDAEGAAGVKAAEAADKEATANESAVKTAMGTASEGATEITQAGAKATQPSGKKKKKRRSRSRGDSVERGEAAKEPPSEARGETIEITDQGEDAADEEGTANESTENAATGSAGKGATKSAEAGAKAAQPSSKKKKKKRRSRSRDGSVDRGEAAKDPPTEAEGTTIEAMDQCEDAETVEAAKGDENEGEGDSVDAATTPTPKSGKTEGSGGEERGRRKRFHGSRSPNGDGGGVVVATGTAPAVPQSPDKIQDGRTEDFDVEGAAGAKAAEAGDKEATANEGTEKIEASAAGKGATESSEAGAEATEPSGKKKKRRRSRSRADSADQGEAAKEPPAEAEGATIEVMDQGEDAETAEVVKGDKNEGGGEGEGADKDEGAGSAAVTPACRGEERPLQSEGARSEASPPPPKATVALPRASGLGGEERARRKRPRSGRSPNRDGGIIAAAPAVPPVPRPSPPPSALTPPPVLDVSVHRLRHLNFIPRPILRLASTPVTPPHLRPPGDGDEAESYEPSYLAVSREGGSVELLAADEKWRAVGTVVGTRGREVDGLAWVCGAGCPTDGAADGTLTDVEPAELGRSPRRLFGSSRDGTIFELDFSSQRQARVFNAGGGGVFALASLCPRCRGRGGGNGSTGGGRCGGFVAAGCEDGRVRVYSAGASVGPGTGGGRRPPPPPELVVSLPPAGQAVLSLAWARDGASAAGGGGGLVGSVLFAGVADGTIRRFDCVSPGRAAAGGGGRRPGDSRGRWVSTLRMTVESLGRRSPTRVWSLRALGDGRTVVSGDSLGHVQLWDGVTGTLIESFDQNDGGADVLDVCVSADERKVFASGVDSRVVCIERVVPPQGPGDGTAQEDPADARWVLTQAQRPHSHDVRSLATCLVRDPGGASPKGTVQELLCSGGLDTKLCTYSTAGNFRTHRPKTRYPWPSLSPVSMAREARVLCLRREDRLDLHQLGPRISLCLVGEGAAGADGTPAAMDEDDTPLGTIEIAGAFNLACSDISDDGRLLAVSDAANLMLFALEYVDDASRPGRDRRIAVPSKINLPKEVSVACTAVKFGPAPTDGGGRHQILICAASSGPIKVLHVSPVAPDVMDVDDAAVAISLEHTFTEHLARGGAPRMPVVELAISPDGRFVAAGRFGLGSGAVDVFSLRGRCLDGATGSGAGAVGGGGGAASYAHYWSLPPTEAPHTALSFLGGAHPKVDAALGVACADNTFYLFDPERRRLSEWSEDAASPVSLSLPRELTQRSDYPTGLVCNPATPNKFLLCAHGFFCAIDLDLPVPEQARMFPPNHVRAKRRRRRRSDSVEGGGGAIVPREKNFTVCLRYAGLLFLDFVGPDEMVVCEQPWMDVVASLPDALERRVYGVN